MTKRRRLHLCEETVNPAAYVTLSGLIATTASYPASAIKRRSLASLSAGTLGLLRSLISMSLS